MGSVYSEIDKVVLTKNAINVQEERTDEFSCVEFFKRSKQRLRETKSERFILEDMLYFCDFINYLSYEFRDKINKLFISSPSTTKMMTYANSYVDFLSTNHSKRIYDDPPKYPF